MAKYQAPSYFNLWRSKPWANSIDQHLNSSVKWATVFHSSLVTNGKHPSSSKNSQFASSASIWSHLKALLLPQTTRPDQPDIKLTSTAISKSLAERSTSGHKKIVIIIIIIIIIILIILIIIIITAH